MNSAAQIAKLEALLERIESNRRPAPGPIALGSTTPRAEAAASPVAPAPVEAAVEAAAVPFVEETTGERVPPPKPTPMEMALEGVGLESAADEVDVEITVDDGPELTIDEGELDEAAPMVEIRAGEIRADEIRADEIRADGIRADGIRAEEPSIPRPIEVTPAQPTAPIARVVSRRAAIEPTTFGELLERTLALRPR